MIFPEEHHKAIRMLIYTAAAILCCCFVVPKFIHLFLPFILAYLFALAIEPVVAWLEKIPKLSRKIASITVIFLLISILGALLFFLLARITYEISDLLSHSNELTLNMQEYLNYFLRSAKWLPEPIADFIRDISNNLSAYLVNSMGMLLHWFWTPFSNTLTSLPVFLIGCMVFLFASYFISSDRTRIMDFLKKLFAGASEKMVRFKNILLFALSAYLKSQLILMLITFVQVYIWLVILKQKYALLLAVVLAVFDALPILGIGSILFPWAAFCVMVADYRTAVILLIIYTLTSAVRQITEPKLMSSRLGIHPLLSILSMFIGFRLYGFIGMMLGPTLAVVVKEWFFSDRQDFKNLS